MSLVADPEVFDRLRGQSPAYKKATNELFQRFLGFGSSYSDQVKANYKLAREQLGVIVQGSGIKTSISEAGMVAVKTEVLRKAQNLNVNDLLQAFSPNNQWIDARLPLMTIFRHALRKSVSFDTLVDSIHNLRDTIIFPNNVSALGGLLNR